MLYMCVQGAAFSFQSQRMCLLVGAAIRAQRWLNATVFQRHMCDLDRCAVWPQTTCGSTEW